MMQAVFLDGKTKDFVVKERKECTKRRYSAFRRARFFLFLVEFLEQMALCTWEVLVTAGRPCFGGSTRYLPCCCD